MDMIISNKDVVNIMGVRLIMYDARDKVLIVHIDSGNIYKFEQYDEDIYYFDTVEQEVFGGFLDIFQMMGQRKYHMIPHKRVITVQNQLITTICSLMSK